MISLDRRTARLVAVGASIAANCLPCLRTAAAEAGRDGIKGHDIAEAIEIGKMVRHCAASPIDKLAASLSRAVEASSFRPAEDGECDCAPRPKKK